MGQGVIMTYDQAMTCLIIAVAILFAAGFTLIQLTDLDEHARLFNQPKPKSDNDILEDEENK